MKRRSDHILTFYKHDFAPATATTDDIDIRDIAHALSYMCRANGHFDRFFSVAQHCINCAHECLARGDGASVALQALLHDASEAYISDVTRPVKSVISGYSEVEEHLCAMIWERFGLRQSQIDIEKVAAVDNAMLYYEFLEMAGESGVSAPDKLSSAPDFSERNYRDVEMEYLSLFAELKGAL